jgi:hypothetical protein
MAPLFISGITSVANTILDRRNQTGEIPGATQSQSKTEFDPLLKASNVAGALLGLVSPVSDTTGPLMQQIMSAPEVAVALNGQNLPPGSNLQFGADGGLAIRLPSGYTEPLALQPETRMLVADLHASMAGAQG